MAAGGAAKAGRCRSLRQAMQLAPTMASVRKAVAAVTLPAGIGPTRSVVLLRRNGQPCGSPVATHLWREEG